MISTIANIISWALSIVGTMAELTDDPAELRWIY